MRVRQGNNVSQDVASDISRGLARDKVASDNTGELSFERHTNAEYNSPMEQSQLANSFDSSSVESLVEMDIIGAESRASGANLMDKLTPAVSASTGSAVSISEVNSPPVVKEGVMGDLGKETNEVAMSHGTTNTPVADKTMEKDKEAITLRKVQALLGRLNFACKIIPAGRIFSRHLSWATVGIKKPYHFIRLNGEHKRDLEIWRLFLQTFNGISLWQDKELSNEEINLYTDAAGGKGMGRYFNGKWFSEPWPSEWYKADITKNMVFLELLPILTSLEVWGEELVKKVIFYCDNMGVVQFLNKMNASSVPVVRLMRSLVLLCMNSNIWLKLRHVPGVNNDVADALSRLQLDRFWNLVPLVEPKAYRAVWLEQIHNGGIIRGELNDQSILDNFLLYIAQLSEKGCSYNMINKRVSALSFLFKLLEIKDITKVFLVRQILKSFKKGHAGKDMRRPLSLPLLSRVFVQLKEICFSGYEESLFKLAFSLAFYGAFRISELISRNKVGNGGKCIGNLGLKDREYASHSFRIGAVTQADFWGLSPMAIRHSFIVWAAKRSDIRKDGRQLVF
uniref:Uncharacterized protein n=1 Tax=Xenopus tropicalis TaxID=8364 RepID=A0A1B8Y586_XENTR